MSDIKLTQKELVVLIRCLGNVLHEKATKDLKIGKHIDDDNSFIILNGIKEKLHKALLERNKE